MGSLFAARRNSSNRGRPWATRSSSSCSRARIRADVTRRPPLRNNQPGMEGRTDVIRLPSEAEWERAARGAGTNVRRLAFIGEFDRAKANTLEAHIRRPSPVGVFPGGRTEDGIEDLTGNVWEWTRSMYGPYPYEI